MDIFSGLNDDQREAVACLEGPLLIMAGAGSGKTRVLTHRIANLLEHGVAPYSILAITFTNKAAAEMRERVENMIGPYAKEIWLSTFHSFCALCQNKFSPISLHQLSAFNAHRFWHYDYDFVSAGCRNRCKSNSSVSRSRFNNCRTRL